jgi:hypothetical protein
MPKRSQRRGKETSYQKALPVKKPVRQTRGRKESSESSEEYSPSPKKVVKPSAS